MKKKLISILFLCSMLVGIIAFALPASASADGNTIVEKSSVPLRIWYDEAAPLLASENKPTAPNGGNDVDESWERWSLPIGNGYFGANVFGRCETERIQISEKTLVNPHSLKNGGTTYTVGGTNSFSETYIDFGHTSVSDYERYLDLNTAISGVKYTSGGVEYTREYFVSYPDKAIVIKLDANTDGKLSFTLRPTIPYEQSYAAFKGDGVTKTGTVTSTVKNGVGEIELSGNMGYYGIDFLGIYKVYTDGGTVKASNTQHSYKDTDGTAKTDTDGTIVVENANSAYIVVTLGTDYELSSDVFTSPETNKPTKSTTLEDTRKKVEGDMQAITSKISSKSFDEAYNLLKNNHLGDYKALFDRVSVNLGAKESDLALTTDALLSKYKSGTQSAYLEMLLFQYGRYLLISSSRDGSLPANLQGVWNTYNMPAWACDYTHNINVEMNYWPAFSTNLAETFKAYVDYNSAYMKQAELYADAIINKINPGLYDKDGGNGWVLGDHTTVYKYTSHESAGNLGFMTQVFWEWYAYTKDPVVLEYVYNVLVNAAKYVTKCVKLDENGNYLIENCDSPEMFVNGIWYYTDGTTYAQSFAYLNNYNALEAAKALGINLNDSELLSSEEYSILNTILEQIYKYDPINVGLSGQIKEFREEDHYCSPGDEYNHRHTSQLVGLYPGNLINSTTPAWLDAAVVTLTERGDLGSGWGVAFKMNHWARTKNGERAHDLLESLFKNYMYENLWAKHPPFQIDANFGVTAGISEMLLQSHEGYIAPLAAMPKAWSTGSYTGLVARGNFEVSAAWENGLAKTFNITSKSGGTASVYYPSITGATVVDSDGNSVNYTVSGQDLISFETEIGKTYIIYGFTAVKTPDAPKNLDFTKDSDGNYNLTWSAASGAKSYNVYVAIENDAAYTLLGNVTGTSFKYVPTAENKNARTTFAVTAVSEGESKRAIAYNNDDLKTEYGIVPKEYLVKPYAVFAKKANDTEYTYVESFDKFINAANKANSLLLATNGSHKGGTAVIYMLRDSQANGDSYNNACQINGTIIFDLGGNRLRSGVNRLIGFEAKHVSGTLSSFSRVEIKNGTLITLSKPVAELYCGGTTGSFAFTGTKKCELLFENVTFSNGVQKTLTDPVSILKSRGTFTETKKAELKAEFKNCTFDYDDAATSFTIIDCSAGGEYAKCDVTIAGGKISTTASVKVFSGSKNDKLTYTSYNGTETEFETTGGGMTTKYGVIPTDKITSSTKFAAFAKKSGESSYTFINTFGGIHSGALNNARDQVKHGSGAYAGGEVVILMLADYEYTSNDGKTDAAWNRGLMVDGTMILDLGGHTITISKARFIGFETGGDDVIGNVADYNTTFKITNGTIRSNNPIAELFSGSSNYSGNKHCQIDLENLTFKSKGATSVTLFKVRGDFKDGQSVDFALNVKNCVFDYSSADTVKLFEETSTTGEAKSTVTITGSVFKAKNGALTFFDSTDSSDSLTFARLDGENYTSLEMPVGSTAPTGTFNSGKLVFVKVYENANTVTYRLRDKAVSDFNFTPKMSITLDGKLVINVYVPAELLTKFTLGSKTYDNLDALEANKREINGKYYYLISTPIDAADGMEPLVLSATVTDGSVTATAKFTFSIPKYALKVLDNGTELEKQLVCDILSYVRAAYRYFKPTDTKAVEEVDAIIGEDYDSTSKYTPAGSEKAPDGFKSATFALTSTPAIKFYLNSGASAEGYSFKINGKTVAFTSAEDADGSYIQIDVYAYAMCETVECYYNGESVGSYHIASYLAWAKTQNDDALVTLVERFWKYAESARDYKNKIQVMINYVDESGKALSSSKTALTMAGESKRLLSPAISGYYTRDLFVTVSSESSKTINVVYKKIPSNLDTDKIKSELLPNIMAWGDSITIGIGKEDLSAANTYGIDLTALGAASTGSNYTDVLKNLIKNHVYSGLANIENFGVGGETTSSIAARADTETYYLYLDGEVSISSAPVKIPLTHYASTGRVGILRQGGAYIVNDVIIEGKDKSGNDISVKGSIAKATLSADAPAGSNTSTCDAKYLEYTFTRTDGGTNTLNFASGARVRARCSYEFDGRTCIIFMGENGGYKDTAELIKQQEEILAACGNPDMYLIISTTSGTTASRTEVRNALKARWGERYINMGDELNSRRAYELAGYSDSVIATVEEKIANGAVSSLLVKDNCHPNAVGYAVIGNIIFERLYDIGAFDALYDYYDSVDTFEYNGYTATVIRPKNPNGKWIWKTEFFYAFDKAEETLADDGYTRVYYSISNKYGSPEAVSLMKSFYHEVTEKYDLDDKCILFGFSRGGLYAFNFALENPECVDKMYLDAPVLDLKTWPTATKNPTEYNQMLSAYGITEADFTSFKGSPVDKLDEFFKLGISLLIVAGDADATVPFDKNAGKLIEYANANGYEITYVVEEGKDHHPHSLTDVSIIVDFCNG